MKKILSLALILVLFYISILLSMNLYAYWHDVPISKSRENNTMLAIGYWQYNKQAIPYNGGTNSKDTFVIHNGALFVALRNTSQSPSNPVVIVTRHWAEITNEYRSHHEYFIGDYVVHQGHTYKALFRHDPGTVSQVAPTPGGSNGTWRHYASTELEGIWYRHKVYFRGQRINHEGVIYECLQIAHAHRPSDPSSKKYWHAV